MHESQKETGSRGSSILTGILLIAFAGSASAVFELENPFSASESQLAASLLALTESTGQSPAVNPEKDTVSEELIDEPVRVGGVPYVVNGVAYQVGYACELRGDVNQIAELAQKQGCRPGFSYKVVQEGKTTVATPKLTNTSYGCHNAGRDIGSGYEKKCVNGSALKSCYPSSFIC